MNDPATSPSLSRLLAIMARLRDPEHGCEWDVAQTFATIVPYTIEEAYEVADAVERGDMKALQQELGDLLLQVVFHARMAEEAGMFGFDDVAAAIADKLVSRHPHVFGRAAGGDERGSEAGGKPDRVPEQDSRWEQLKAAERAADGATSALDGVANALPALMRADKLQKRAARVGFDWGDTAGPTAKLAEEVAELAAADTAEDRLAEAGDLLFAAVNVVRAYGVAPEDALRLGNAKFERRFKAMERLASAQGREFAALSLAEQEALWQAVKDAE